MKRREPSELNQIFSRFPTPTAAVLELTNRCNLECVHCVRESPQEHGRDEMSVEDWIRVLDDLATINTFSVCFTGGEATAYPGLLPLVRHARSLRMNVSLKTNGLTLARIAPALRDAGVGFLEVSLYGATAATHERCTQVPGSFQRTVDGIRTVRAAGIPVTINVNLFRWNAHEVPEIRQLGRDLDCVVNREYFLTTTDLGRHFAAEILSPEQIRKVEEAWPGCTIPANQNGKESVKVCAQGMNTVAVTATGEVLSCVTIRKSLGHAKTEGVAAVWRRCTPGSRTTERAHAVDYGRFHRCQSCEYLPKCHVCIGQNLAATGDLYEPPLERCYITMSLFGRNDRQAAEVSC